MIIKSVEIARVLGISKASVSLALNGKPGVSSETREAILRCKAELEQKTMQRQSSRSGIPAASQAAQDTSETTHSKMLKIIVFERGVSVINDTALNLWSEFLSLFERLAKTHGYFISLTYADLEPENTTNIVTECNQSDIFGVLLFATEMQPEDYIPFSGITKPMVIYDNNLTDQHHCIVADNTDITRQCISHLVSKGYQKMIYLAHNISIYNFEMRRFGFIEGIYSQGLEPSACAMLKVGDTIEDIERYMSAWIKDHPLPDVFITESYRASIGLMQSLQKQGIGVPDQVGVIGIDEVPSYMAAGKRLSHIHIDHIDRVSIALNMLINDINNETAQAKHIIILRSRIIEGETLR